MKAICVAKWEIKFKLMRNAEGINTTAASTINAGSFQNFSS